MLCIGSHVKRLRHDKDITPRYVMTKPFWLGGRGVEEITAEASKMVIISPPLPQPPPSCPIMKPLPSNYAILPRPPSSLIPPSVLVAWVWHRWPTTPPFRPYSHRMSSDLMHQFPLSPPMFVHILLHQRHNRHSPATACIYINDWGHYCGGCSQIRFHTPTLLPQIFIFGTPP